MPTYRKIYEEHYGPIPRDHNGRSFDIHHIDGNKKNNDPKNLVALSIEDHLKVHRDQGDHKAVLAIMLRLNHSPEAIKEAASRAAIQRVEEGSHHWLGGDLQRKLLKKLKEQGKLFMASEEHRRNTSELNKRRIQEGTHNFLSDHHKGIVSETNKKRLSSGDHPFCQGVGPENSRKRVKEGTHHFLDAQKQKELSDRAKLKNSYVVDRIDENGNVETYVGILNAVKATEGSTYTLVQKAMKNQEPYLGYHWINKGKGAA